MNAHTMLAKLKASQKATGNIYPLKHKMMAVIWDHRTMTTVSSFELLPIVREWYDRVIKEDNISSEYLLKNYGIIR